MLRTCSRAVESMICRISGSVQLAIGRDRTTLPRLMTTIDVYLVPKYDSTKSDFGEGDGFFVGQRVAEFLSRQLPVPAKSTMRISGGQEPAPVSGH